MSFKTLVRDLKELRDGIGSMSRRQSRKHLRGRTRSHIAPDETPQLEPDRQGKWANLPPELLLDIIKRVEQSESTWPERAAVVCCASVCKSWREVAKEIVQTPEQCGKLTFPISLKQAGPRESPIQCFIKRDSATSVYSLYYGLVPAEGINEKLLMVAKRVRRATRTEFAISLVASDFSRGKRSCLGKLRSNFLGTKFTIHDSLSGSGTPPSSKQVPRKSHGAEICTGTVKYELNVLRTRGPRRMRCTMHSIPFSAIEEGGSVPTPASFMDDEYVSELGFCGPSLSMKNKSPRWHEQLQCWCLNFKGRVTVASVKNFQLVAAIEGETSVAEAEYERVILQFGKIGKDIFTMDYCYPLSALQAFAICLSGFDTKPVCE